ncbi:MAG TPA: DNA-protecting protein DprA, partial [Sphingomonas sp.]|nr:DNA-protecting protein DprA [Sphingomonas sp.]
ISGMSGEVRSDRAAYQPTPIALDVDESALETVRRLMSHSPVQIDELVRQSGLAAPVVNAALLDLELIGTIVRHAGNRVALN